MVKLLAFHFLPSLPLPCLPHFSPFSSLIALSPSKPVVAVHPQALGPIDTTLKIRGKTLYSELPLPLELWSSGAQGNVVKIPLVLPGFLHPQSL